MSVDRKRQNQGEEAASELQREFQRDTRNRENRGKFPIFLS